MTQNPSRLSPYANGETLALLKQLRNDPLCLLATGDAAGLSAKFPFRDDTVLLRATTDESYPRYGRGLNVTLSFRDPKADSRQVLKAAARKCLASTPGRT